MITRRGFLRLLGAGLITPFAFGGYAFAIEPLYRLRLRTYKLVPPRWPAGLKLRVALVADIHACKPWMTSGRITEIVHRTNDLEPDLTLLLGDYSSGINYVLGDVHSNEWAPILGELKARHGVYAILGNHDWWHDRTAQRRGHGPTFGQNALEANGIPVLENRAVKLVQDGLGFWLAGLGDQLAFPPSRKTGNGWRGVDDLPATLAQIDDDDAPVLLMAHEPDIFPQVPERVSLTLSGHTHGGQVRLFGYSPVVPSRYGNRFAYGHVVEEGRHLVVSGGLGCSIAPVRFGMPPEIVLLELGQEV